MQSKGMTLIEVPCWWDGQLASLEAAISFKRPDLCSSNHFAIPFNPPASYFASSELPDVGELMLASFPTDPNFSLNISSNSWWIGEKYDGMRVLWNSNMQTLYPTRNEYKLISVLPVLLNWFPKYNMDTEFWFGRGYFNNVHMLISGSIELVKWHLLRVMAFDVPTHQFQNVVFEKRYAFLINKLEQDHPFSVSKKQEREKREGTTSKRVVVPRMECKDSVHLNRVIRYVIENEGEGVILQKFASLYDHGRTSNLIKLKTATGDMEGIVVGINKNKSVKLKLPNGETINVPEQDVEITPDIGQVVSFSFTSSSKRNTPVRPIIYRIRSDLLWDDVVLNFAKERQFLNAIESSRVAKKGSEYEASEGNLQRVSPVTKAKLRSIFERIARDLGRDPLSARLWYDIPYSLILHKCQNAVLGKMRGGYLKILRFLFPELQFDSSFFKRYSWIKMIHRRQFFENYAKDHGFSPKDPENWYTQPKDNILSTKGASSVLFYHKHSIPQALVDLFPDIGLDKAKFRVVWNCKDNRRLFFENFAKHHQFDPLVASHWSDHKHHLSSLQEMNKILHYHEYSLSRALADLFPEVHFTFSPSHSRGFWRDVNNRKHFFENYAKKRGFDPLSASHWYKQPIEKIGAEKDVRRALVHHQGSVVTALAELFPTINFDQTMFGRDAERAVEVAEVTKSLKKDAYSDEKMRIEFFETFASKKGFNSLQNSHWYTQSRDEILSLEDATSVLRHHENSIVRALLDLFPQIGLDKAKLQSQYVWSVKENRRRFFEKYAKKKQFDHLIAENWYKQSREDISSEKGAKGVMSYYGQSLINGLIDVFPNIGLERNKFQIQGQVKYLLRKVQQRRQFFEKYANEHGFDALNAENWYSCSKPSISACRGYTHVLAYCNFNISKALLDVFPDIGLDKTRLSL